MENSYVFGKEFRKYELLVLHEVLFKICIMLERAGAIDMDDYWDFGVFPIEIDRPKREHEKAVALLAHKLKSFFEEKTIKGSS